MDILDLKDMKGHYLVMDNAPIRKSTPITEAIENRFDKSTILPPCSPFLSLIEEFCSKVKAGARRRQLSDSDSLTAHLALVDQIALVFFQTQNSAPGRMDFNCIKEDLAKMPSAPDTRMQVYVNRLNNLISIHEQYFDAEELALDLKALQTQLTTALQDLERSERQIKLTCNTFQIFLIYILIASVFAINIVRIILVLLGLLLGWGIKYLLAERVHKNMVVLEHLHDLAEGTLKLAKRTKLSCV
ncbi:hypothetical protein EC973_007672 [Apophysomyces ossiformis]|uniref:Tc1-like transposase DDE domain-containing protein n=1 Tax=Apophysomyces ossiformis TaxID=679940 RepID=A0A8H7BVW2_9FUNG|nr:hypothetical protein EC973_007672 [Apophysomyces ossiformis]